MAELVLAFEIGIDLFDDRAGPIAPLLDIEDARVIQAFPFD